MNVSLSRQPSESLIIISWERRYSIFIMIYIYIYKVQLLRCIVRSQRNLIEAVGSGTLCREDLLVLNFEGGLGIVGKASCARTQQEHTVSSRATYAKNKSFREKAGGTWSWKAFFFWSC